MTNITAIRAGEALSTVATTLLNYKIIRSEGYTVLMRLSAGLKQAKDSLSWTIEVDRGEPISFERTTDEKSRGVTPHIIAKGIRIEQGDGNLLPFKALDIALEVNDDARNPLSRWHLDIANKTGKTYQSGPIAHLQFGGHHHTGREHDHPLKVPRWCHPPMEVVLLCEVVAANFYEEYWLELREEPSWCQAISLYQKLCYTHYVDRMNHCLSISSSTMLNGMWASTYT